MEYSINHLSAASSILFFILFIGYQFLNEKTIIFSELVTVIIGGGMLPIALGFVIYPFYPNLLGVLEERYLQITQIGLVLLFYYIDSILKKM